MRKLRHHAKGAFYIRANPEDRKPLSHIWLTTHQEAAATHPFSGLAAATENSEHKPSALWRIAVYQRARLQATCAEAESRSHPAWSPGLLSSPPECHLRPIHSWLSRFSCHIVRDSFLRLCRQNNLVNSEQATVLA